MSDPTQQFADLMKAAGIGGDTKSNSSGKSDLPDALVWLNPVSEVEGRDGTYWANETQRGAPVVDETIAADYLAAFKESQEAGETSCIVMVPVRVTVPGTKKERGKRAKKLERVSL